MKASELKGVSVTKISRDYMDADFPFASVFYYADSEQENEILRCRLFWDAYNGLWRIYSISAFSDGVPVIRDYTRREKAVNAYWETVTALDREFEKITGCRLINA